MYSQKYCRRIIGDENYFKANKFGNEKEEDIHAFYAMIFNMLITNKN